MKRLVFLILIFQFLFLINCKKDQKVIVENQKRILLKNSFSQKPLMFSEIIDSITYVKLETSKKCIVGEIQKIINYKNRFYIHDRKTKSILWFTSKGEYLNKIRQIGKGPGEYLNISEFFILNDRIHIYDNRLRKIFLFSIEGEFINSIKTGRDLIRYLIPLDDGGYLCNNEFDDGKSSRTGIWKINSQGKFEKEYLKFDKHLEMLFFWSPMYKFESEIRFLSHLDNSIYSFKVNILEDDILKKIYSYDFEELLTIDDIKKGAIDDKELEIGNYSVKETKDWIISEWPDPNFKNPTKIVFHSKKNDDVIISEGYMNDICGITGSFVKSDFTNNILYSILSSSDILKTKDVILKSIGNDISQFDDVKETDNPVIQIFHFK
ncbi:6-bladed beta-propeller [Jejuia pallidilutea]|uniref:6-bladed beta-propeller protein n=1 Tax=Jejuia pallidilutea TaxID=504487 RepID=A0A098LS34_9FLAO|nr:6-bladed beta-propeller [Jejuia pallidilutea]GAL89705.1 hypothetical protein JCM19538_1767 [Jejuia pallidilutea]